MGLLHLYRVTDGVIDPSFFVLELVIFLASSFLYDEFGNVGYGAALASQFIALTCS